MSPKLVLSLFNGLCEHQQYQQYIIGVLFHVLLVEKDISHQICSRQLEIFLLLHYIFEQFEWKNPGLGHQLLVIKIIAFPGGDYGPSEVPIDHGAVARLY